MREFIIGTRGSPLALWQANFIRSALESRYPKQKFSLAKIKTKGDKITGVSLAQIGGKGLFVKEIEEALAQKRIDLAVHSAKDIPVELHHGLHIAAFTEREDPRDCLISSNGIIFKNLPSKAKIGTSSLRRKSQLAKMRSDLTIIDLRGNLDTRIKKLTLRHYDGIIVAVAGVKRLNFDKYITEILPFKIMLPAIGQGTLGIETRKVDAEINEIVSTLNHEPTSIALKAERSFLRRLEGGCQVPIAAYAELSEKGLQIRGLVASVDGKEIVQDEMIGDQSQAEVMGTNLAEKLLAKGAKQILEEVYGKKIG